MSSRWILVVDDDDDVRDTLMLLLDMNGYAVIGASDGHDALQQIRLYGRPGLILLDLRMPHMNGEEFAATLHADTALAPAPIVVFSGDTNAPGIASRMGAQALLKKPVDLTEIIDVVRRVMPDGRS